MKAIILAAGQGTRLKPLTLNQPKCMVKVNGKTIIERQLKTFESIGITKRDIIIIDGYKADVLEKFLHSKNVCFVRNHQYKKTNMVYSLMCAKTILADTDDVIVSYGDILYEVELLKEVIESKEEYAVVVDRGWLEYWKTRFSNPLDDAETLRLDGNKYIVEIGQKAVSLQQIEGQYIGLMHFRKKAISEIISLCEDLKRNGDKEKRFLCERAYENFYMTDLLQELITRGNWVKAIETNRKWYEIDCLKDLEIVQKIL